MKKIKPKKGQRKQKPVYDNITFDSSLEIYCYKQLKTEGIKFEYTPHTFVLDYPFTYTQGDIYEPDLKRGKLLSKRTAKYQAIRYTPDFVGDGWIIETKGRMNERFEVVWKLFKHYLTDNDIKFDLYLPKNQKQVDQCIELIQSNK